MTANDGYHNKGSDAIHGVADNQRSGKLKGLWVKKGGPGLRNPRQSPLVGKVAMSVGNIQKPDYETVTAECEHCGSRCVYNRIDDIGEPGPYAGRHIECLVCREQLWIFGDIINPAYELLVFAASERFETKRYMQCVAMLGQAWEMFFSLFAYSNYLYRPFFEDPDLDYRDEHFDRLVAQLNKTMRRFTFFSLRNALTNTMLKGVHPQTLQESEAAISKIGDENFGNDPKRVDIEHFPNEELRSLLKKLQQLKIANLRNDVVHQHAYRPRRADVEECLEEDIALLYRVKIRLPVFTFSEWSARKSRRGWS